MMLVLQTEKVIIIRVGVKFIEMMFPLKNDYDSLKYHRPANVITIMTEATELLAFFFFFALSEPCGQKISSLYIFRYCGHFI